MKFKSYPIFSAALLTLSLLCMTELSSASMNMNRVHEVDSKATSAEDQEVISHYTCGMHPSVKVSPENYDKGDTKCPICFMPLTPAKQSGGHDEAWDENVISRVVIKARELQLAGIKTVAVKRQQLFKTIRAVGRVAYDPQMAIAQDEFISTLKSHEKSKQGNIPEIVERSKALLESSKRKLLLLGLNEKQIIGLEQTREVQTNLILPGEKMWIYGDVYEYELGWIKPGSYLTVRPLSLAGEEFFGEIVSINPVIDPQTRSVRFRALISNPNKKLKPEMYVDIEIMSQYKDPEGNEEVLSIPKSAFLDTGRRKIVWVAKGDGQFEGRLVKIGPEAIGHAMGKPRLYPVLGGLQEGERVVTRGNFLIDSQSQITGVVSSSYGGALDSKEKSPMKHRH